MPANTPSHQCTLDDQHYCEECGTDWQECEDCYQLFRSTTSLSFHWLRIHYPRDSRVSQIDLGPNIPEAPACGA